MKLSELQKEYGDITLSDNVIKSIRKELNSIPCPSWIRKENNRHFVIHSEGDVMAYSYTGCDIDEKRLTLGNFFRTREEAEFESERRKIEAKLLSLGGTRVVRYNVKGLSYMLIYHMKKLDIVGIDNDFLHQGTIYFKDKDTLMNAIKIIGEKRIKKYLFYIDEE